MFGSIVRLDGPVTTKEVLAKFPRLTPHTLESWGRKGFAMPISHGRGRNKYREYPESEVEVIRLMLDNLDAGYVLQRAAELARAEVETLRKPLVLIVDHDRAVRLLYPHRLGRHCRLMFEDTGERALGRLRQSEAERDRTTDPALLIVELRLPMRRGERPSLQDSLRVAEKRGGRRLILITEGQHGSDDLAAFRPDKILTKPFSMGALENAVCEVLLGRQGP